MAVAALCADATQLTVLDEQMHSIVTDADAVLRDAVTRKGKLTLIPAHITSRGPKKVLFRPLDHDNIRLWMRQVEDVFDTMCITSQLNKFTTLTTLLSADEATVIQDLTLAQPRPDDVFEQAKLLLFTRYDRPIHERLTRAITMGGFEEDEMPSQWLARFRQTRGDCSIDDLEPWALVRQMPHVLHPTLDALQPAPSLDEFVKHADRLIKTVTPQAVSQVVKKSSSPNHPPRHKKNVCWFHERFNNDAHTCEGSWCSQYADGITIRKHRSSGNERGERQ